MVSKELSFSEIDAKWQKRWNKEKAFEVSEDKKKKKFYVLEMYPYPSGSGLHMGHAFNYTIGDVYARMKTMQGFNVLHPAGYDSFGLPAENAAIKEKSHPRLFVDSAIKNFMQQQKSLGLSYDWTRVLWSHNEEYYKWNQFIFIELYKKGLVYRKKSPVNWCPKCNTVLANEQVHNGKCWRHSDTDVVIKPLEQWFIKTTAYAEELLSHVDKLDWPERIKIMQKNWIGRSEGSEIIFKVGRDAWPVFTTRADTIMGVTFLVVSAQHPKLSELVTKEQKKDVDTFLKKIKSTSEKDAIDLEKDGVFTGSYAEHPITKEKIPIWTGNFVVADYGSGMVMAVPAHDQRDYEFAKKYNIAIKRVVAPLYVNKKGSDAYKANEAPVKRKAVVAIVKNPKNNKYMILEWKKNDWKGFVTGGVEEGENPIQTAKREIEEETGYTDIEFIREIEGPVYSRFYHELKKQNREAHFQGLYFELKSEKRNEISKEEQAIHTISWIDEKNVARFMNRDNDMLMIWNKYLKSDSAFTDYGILFNSEGFDGLESAEARIHITKMLEEKGLGKQVVQYKLRDWLVSRQRYWGTPIPFVYCDKCGCMPVSEKELPVLLPEDIKFGEGNPLETSKTFVSAKCPKCKGKARRETDTMDTFFDSSWYYLRFTDAQNKKEPFSKKNAEYWMPVDFYTGGAEHACMHLIYARFFTKALRDLGYLKVDEPFTRLFNQGMIHGEDGFVMSKSRGNVVDPLTISSKYGSDALRMFLVSVASPDKDFSWSVNGFEGSHRFIQKLYNYAREVKFIKKSSPKIEHKVNSSIKDVTRFIEDVQYNLAVISLRELFKAFEEEGCDKKSFEAFLQMLTPFCPHLCEELWERLGHKDLISLSEWPAADEKKIDENFDKADKAAEQLSKDILNLVNLVKEKSGTVVKKAYVYTIPPEKGIYSSEVLEKKAGIPVSIFAINDKDKYDPQNKAQKAKPGKPGIYLE